MTDFQKALQKHLEEWRARQQPPTTGLKVGHWLEGIYWRFHELAPALEAEGFKPHQHVRHLRSSQAFALNLFLPFREAGARAALNERVSALIGVPLTIDRVSFEWVPPDRLLRERTPKSAAATAVDVVLWGRGVSVGTVAVLVEVKLSEEEFGCCGGMKSPHNDRPDVCDSARRFFTEPNDCYLIRSAGARPGNHRRYWEIFAAAAGSVRDAFPNAGRGKCPFAYDMNQPMRNLAIARALEQDGHVDRAWFVLCAHDANPEIKQHWAAWQALLPAPAMAPSLLASEVIACGEAAGLGEWADYMSRRYMINDWHSALARQLLEGRKNTKGESP